MKRRKRNKRQVLRTILAANVARLMDKKFPESENKPSALAKRSGISLSTVQRLLACETAASIDLVEILSEAFLIEAYELLLPNTSNLLRFPQAAKKAQE